MRFTWPEYHHKHACRLVSSYRLGLGLLGMCPNFLNALDMPSLSTTLVAFHRCSTCYDPTLENPYKYPPRTTAQMCDVWAQFKKRAAAAALIAQSATAKPLKSERVCLVLNTQDADTMFGYRCISCIACNLGWLIVMGVSKCIHVSMPTPVSRSIGWTFLFNVVMRLFVSEMKLGSSSSSIVSSSMGGGRGGTLIGGGRQ
eukprot:scaffold17088_cov127-Isochrysis_galbana.AAC.2